MKVEQNFGDGAIAFAAQPRVERAQGQDMPLSKLSRHRTEVGARWTAVDCAPEAASGMGAQFQKGIHRQRRGVESGSVGNGLWKPELVRDAIDLPDAVPAIGRLA